MFNDKMTHSYTQSYKSVNRGYSYLLNSENDPTHISHMYLISRSQTQIT